MDEPKVGFAATVPIIRITEAQAVALKAALESLSRGPCKGRVMVLRDRFEITPLDDADTPLVVEG